MIFVDTASSCYLHKSACLEAPASVYWLHTNKTVPYPSGKGEVCKTFMHRFESDRHLVPEPALTVVRVSFCGALELVGTPLFFRCPEFQQDSVHQCRVRLPG